MGRSQSKQNPIADGVSISSVNNNYDVNSSSKQPTTSSERSGKRSGKWSSAPEKQTPRVPVAPEERKASVINSPVAQKVRKMSVASMSSNDGYEPQRSEAPPTSNKKATFNWGRPQPVAPQVPQGSLPQPRTTGKGRYVLGDKIGRGGFGVVYLGMDVITAQHVAVKEMQVAASDLTAVANVKSEFDMLVSLKHPHVVGVRGFDLLEDRAYIYMEWMPGGSVSGMLASFKFRLHEGLIRRYVRQALLGLAYLHSQGVVHRDIKPANMLVTLDGTLKLSDFGTCKTISEKSSSTMKIVGTPSYMSPEAIRGKTSFGSDVWALGASLVEMASGHAPWSELGLSDPIALLFHIGMVPQGDGTEHHPEVPEHLSAEAKGFLKMCFVVDSKKRATCEQLLVHPFLSGDVPSPDGIEEIDSYLLTRESSNKSMISTLSSQVTQLLPFTNEEPSPQTLHERYGDVHVLPVPTGPVPEEDTDSGSEEDDYTEDGRTSTGQKYFLEKRDPSSITTHINAATFTESKPPDPQSYSIPDESRSLTSTKQKFAPPKRVTESKQGV